MDDLEEISEEKRESSNEREKELRRCLRPTFLEFLTPYGGAKSYSRRASHILGNNSDIAARTVDRARKYYSVLFAVHLAELFGAVALGSAIADKISSYIN